MFQDLKLIIDILRSACSGLSKLRQKSEREETLLSMLKLYFLLKDCVDDGQAMLMEAGTDPLEALQVMKPDRKCATLERWTATITKQGRRLLMLNSLIFDQPHLTVLDPALQDKISEIIGYKMDSVVTLHGIGAALFFRVSLGFGKEVEEECSYVRLLAGVDESTNIINVPKLTGEIAAFRESLDAYRSVVERLVPDADVLKLSRRAREETIL